MRLQNMKRGEDTEQMRVMYWAAAAECRYPQLKWLHHIPNGGTRNSAEAIKLKQMGVKRGISDLHLPYPRGKYCGMYIEMKYGKNVTTREQAEFLCDMKAAGHCVAVCHDAQAAIELITRYMELPAKGIISVTDMKDQNFYWDDNDICHIQSTQPFA